VIEKTIPQIFTNFEVSMWLYR